MSRTINIGRSSPFSYAKLSYYLGLCKREHIGLSNKYGFRCENQIAKLVTVSVDATTKVEKPVSKKSKYLTTNVINVTNEAVTSKTTKVKRLKQAQLLDKWKTTDSEIKTSSTLASSPRNLLRLFESSNTNSDYFRSEFQDDHIDNKNLGYCEGDAVSFGNENTVINQYEASSSSILIASNSTSKSKSVQKQNVRKGLSSGALQKLIDQMKSNSKIYSFNCNLEAFLFVCSDGNADLQEAAFRVFLHFTKNKKQFQLISDIKVYNEALKCLEKLKHHDVNLVIAPLQKSEVQPNVSTFALIFSCLGRRLKSAKNCADVTHTLQWMERQNILISDMLRDAVLSQESLKYCIEALLRVNQNISDHLCSGICGSSLLKYNEYQNELLKSLNDSLLSPQISSPADGVVDLEELEKFTKEQMDLELKGFISIPSIAKFSNEKIVAKNISLLDQWEEEWRCALYKTIEDQKMFRCQNFLKAPINPSRFDVYPFYSAVDTEDLVNLLIIEIHKLCGGLTNGNISFDTLCYFLGCQVYKRYLIKYKQRLELLKNFETVYQNYKGWYINQSSAVFSYVPRIQWDYIINTTGNSALKDSPPEWPYPVKKSVGLILYNVLMSSVKIYDPNAKVKIPISAFTKVHHQHDGKRTLGLEISPYLLNVVKMTEKKRLIFTPEDLPMVVPPVPWTSTKLGGYLLTQTDFIRHVPHAHLQKKRIFERGFQHIYPVIDSLNQLGSIPWRINGEMLDFITELFNDTGWEELDLCSAKPSCPVPPNYEPSMTKEERKQLRYQKRQYKKKMQENYSIWCDTLYKLSLANHYRNRIIWLPQNIDFRGRTYPIPPHLTHLSSDLFRSTLLFAQGKELGKEGLMWLKLHIINLSGLKKRCSIMERLDYAEEVLDDIIDSAKNPVDGRRWWTKSDEPWQTLAACKELSKALSSDNPEEFISHLPVHQDGSCNGLQHYAALGRDEQGARSVNLKPSDLPQDIYSDVVRVVEEKRKHDSANGNDIAIELDGYVIRKVIKQTIMTTVYGVTQYGAQEQIARQLRYLNFPAKRVKYASYYLAVATFESLGKLFMPTQKIQNWLVKCADGLSHICLQNVEWVTPLGLPVVQPYTKVQQLRGCCLPGLIPLHFHNDQFAVPNRVKQKNAFPPNFIHSLDSSHMMLTSLYCQQAGISFVSVHDCFWTHASTVPIMNKICREQFVKLHSMPVLEDLSKFLIQRVEEHKLLCSANVLKGDTGLGSRIKNESVSTFQDHLKRLPKKGIFDLNEVKESIYFFS